MGLFDLIQRFVKRDYGRVVLRSTSYFGRKQTTMKKTILYFLLAGVMVMTGTVVKAQNKIGYISFNELMAAMPELKKADTVLAEYRAALEQKFEDYKAEFQQKSKQLSGPDTAKLTKPQLELKRKSLQELLAKLQGYEQEAGNELQEKRNALLAPIQKKAEDVIQVVAKDNGYTYVMEKEGLHVFPPADDILPLVKKKLGLK